MKLVMDFKKTRHYTKCTTIYKIKVLCTKYWVLIVHDNVRGKQMLTYYGHDGKLSNVPI